jgi:hypothetical protein
MPSKPAKGGRTWRDVWALQLHEASAASKRGLRQVFLAQQAAGKIGSGICGRCHLGLSPRLITVLPCGHRRCQPCLERSVGDVLFPRPQPRDELSAARAARVGQARRAMHTCEECLDLAIVLRQPAWFNPEVTECPITLGRPLTATVVTPAVLASKRLQQFIRVVRYYENERYVVMRGFSSSHLLMADVRGHYSDENTDPVEPATLNELPNSRWHFIDDWFVDKTIGDKDGWRYALNWPGGIVPGTQWHDSAQWNSIVRQRRWRRTCVNFGDALLALFDRLDA